MIYIMAFFKNIYMFCPCLIQPSISTVKIVSIQVDYVKCFSVIKLEKLGKPGKFFSWGNLKRRLVVCDKPRRFGKLSNNCYRTRSKMELISINRADLSFAGCIVFCFLGYNSFFAAVFVRLKVKKRFYKIKKVGYYLLELFKVWEVENQK